MERNPLPVNIVTNLKEHEKIHNGEKTFVCLHCDNKFTQKAHLKRHEMIHISEKPFSCNICDKKFRRSEHLKRHEVTHTSKTRVKTEL